MNKLFFFFCCLAFGFSPLQAQIDIAVARTMAEGSTVTIKGIATNGSEQGIIRYIQDATGGLPAYPGAGSIGDFPDDVKRGDLVSVTGTLKIFNGLLEIDPITAYTVESSGNTLPTPELVTPDGINDESEGKLMRVEGVSFVDGGSVFSVGNFTFEANGESGEIYVRTNHALIGTTIPLGTANLVGLSSQFNGKHQLLLRDENDLVIADDFYLTSPLTQSNITKNGFSISWSTNEAASSNLRYGTDPDNLDQEILDGGSTSNHSVAISGLDPAEFYYVQAFSDNGSSTVNSIVNVFSTASNSSGAIKIYFNRGVDGNFSNGSYAEGYTPTVLETAIIDRIKAAKTSIDASIYNVNRNTIIQALTDAHNRGVVVRYTTDNETSNLALQDVNPPFRVIKGNADGLMHNKFFNIDADSPDDAWVIMGSTNMTSQNIADDSNNTIFIQDQAIAKAYTLEFNEMWGADGVDPGIFNLRFGELKKNNTPHLFQVKNMLVESYFSPSDNTTVAISNAIATADEDLQFALLVFTNNELSSASLNAHNNNIDVRGIIDQINSQGSDYEFLSNSGVNVIPDNLTLQTHHKYCIIDATKPDSDPQVITGSHNWSAGAERSNDENTLIFHDKNIANIFLQEFEARWCESNGGVSCITGNEEVNEIAGFEATVFPNPAVDQTQLSFNLAERNDLTISLWNTAGELLQAQVLRDLKGEYTETLSLEGLAVGNYFVTFGIENQYAVKKLQVVK